MTIEVRQDYYNVQGFYVRNGGLGPAMNLTLSYEAEVDRYEATKNSEGFVVGEEKAETVPFGRSISVDDVISAPGSRSISLDDEGSEILTGRIRFSSASIIYFDVFGNTYSTHYKDLTTGKFSWKRPRMRAR